MHKKLLELISEWKCCKIQDQNTKVLLYSSKEQLKFVFLKNVIYNSTK